eukprot:Gb_28651 [translate_table: standard]
MIMENPLASCCGVERGSVDASGATELRGPVNFDYKILRDATRNFDALNKVGEGGFSQVYKGTIKNGKTVAVKKLSLGKSPRVVAEFEGEVKLISNVHHRNLVWKLKKMDQLMEVVDEGMKEIGYPREEVLRVIQLALLCTQASVASKLAMSEVVAMLISMADVKPQITIQRAFTDVAHRLRAVDDWLSVAWIECSDYSSRLVYAANTMHEAAQCSQCPIPIEPTARCHILYSVGRIAFSSLWAPLYNGLLHEWCMIGDIYIFDF